MQRLPIPDLAPTVTTVGGGITPINQVWLQKLLGNELILGIGGAVQGHPMGVTQGAIAAMTAVRATAAGIPLKTAAENCSALQKCLQLWG